MLTEKNAKRIAGLVVLVIASIAYYLSVERTGSLWDCGEFVLAAYKLQVVHPPGAPLFLIVGRMFTFLAEIFSDDPSSIAFAVNLMSGCVQPLRPRLFVGRLFCLVRLLWSAEPGRLLRENVLPSCLPVS